MQSEELVFDLGKSPPTAAQLQMRVEHLVQLENTGKRLYIAFSVSFVAFAIAASIIIEPYNSMGWLLLGSILFFATMGLLAIIFLTMSFADKTTTRLAETQAVTPESEPDAYLALAELAKADQAILQYFQAVAAQGRSPVLGEIEAAKAWVMATAQRQRQAEAQDAWQNALSAPAPAKGAGVTR